MRPEGLKAKIFLDSGDPVETKEALELLGFLDGQTTNPTLLAKNPTVQEKIAKGEHLTDEEIYAKYESIAKEISALIPEGSVSLEVYADDGTSAEEMLKHAKEMYSWIPNAHIKFPIIPAGLEAAEQAVKEGMRVNMTLCFTQEQAAAVYSATAGAVKGDVFVSPFIGRFDDRGENGMTLIKNLVEMYKTGDGHVEVLAASVRNLDHFLGSIHLGADILTCPLKVLKEWAEKGMPLPDENFSIEKAELKPIPFKEISLEQPWQEIKFSHELLDNGLKRFADDWNNLAGRT